ncbi:MAG: DUF2868 domain-containing protein [Desulfosalsimonas sp.]
MSPKWKIKDVIDFEYFLGGEETASARHNRQIYLEYARNQPDSHQDRRAVFKYWLNRLRQSASQDSGADALPGEIYTEAAAASRLIISALALVSGAGLTWSLLSYGGATPVNVFTCLWVLLAPQIALLIALAAGSFIYRFRRPGRPARGLYAIISGLMLRISRRIINYAAAKTPQDKQNALRSALATAGRSRSLYGGLFYWPVFNTAQLTGIAFNAGILAALVLRIMITDVAFGWQSTLQPEPQTVYRIVEIIALPWAWLADPPAAHPTAAQIAGSRMVLKDGIYNLATGDLVSWWPFLCLCIGFYGLAPRVLLLILGLWRKNRHLAKLEFAHASCERLWSQMTSPQVQTASRGYKKTGVQPQAEANPAELSPGTFEDTGLTPGVVAVPEEIEINSHFLDQQIRARLGLVPEAMVRVTGDPELDAEKLFSQPDRENKNARRLVLIQESWQPPIKENLAWISRLRQASGHNIPAVVCLIGRPGEKGAFAGSVEKSERIIWEQAINSLGDPYIRVEALGEHGSDE